MVLEVDGSESGNCEGRTAGGCATSDVLLR